MAERCSECHAFMRKLRRADETDEWFCTNCGIDDPLLEQTKAICDALDRKRGDTGALAFGLAHAIAGSQAVSGLAPSVAAATCVYLASILADNKLTQPQVADAADVGEASIRNNYPAIYEASGYDEHFGPIRGGEMTPAPNEAIDLDGWTDHLSERGHADDTVKTTVSDVRRFALWYDGDGDPSPADVRQWLQHLADEGYAPATIDGRFTSAAKYFDWAGLADLDAETVDLEAAIESAWAERLKA